MAQDPEQLEALLAQYVEGTLDDAGIRTVESHLATHPAARVLIDEMRSDRAALGQLPRLTVPSDLSEDLRGQLERDLLLNDRPLSAMRGRRFSPTVAAVAAMLFVGLGLGAVAYVLLGDRPKPFLDVALRDSAEGTNTTMPAVGRTEPKGAVGQAEADKVSDVPAKGGVSADASTFSRKADVADVAARDRAVVEEAAGNKTEALTPSAGVAAATDAASSVTAGAPTEAHVGATTPPLGAISPLANEAVASPAVAAPTMAAPIAPSLQIAESAPPADVITALAGKSFDLSRRSVVIVVDQRDALDALATVSHAARVAGTPLEVSDRAAQVALPGSANVTQQQQQAMNSNIASNAMPNAQSRNLATQNVQDAPAAEVAVVARGLTAAATASLQFDLKKMQPAIESDAFDVPQEMVEPPVTTPATPTTATPTTAPTTAPARPMRTATDVLMGGSALRKASSPTASPTTVPATRPTSAGIANGEHLRVTLTDPDAFDLRTQHEVVVDARGGIALPSLASVHAAGESIDTLRTSIADAYKAAGLMRHAIVRVESIDSGAASKDAADASKLLDVYVVVRRSAAAMPATTEPTTAPTTQP